MTRKILNFQLPLRIASALGANTPNPGANMPGVVAFSTALNRLLCWDGTSWGDIVQAATETLLGTVRTVLTSHGTSDSGKVPVLNGNGLLDASFLPNTSGAPTDAKYVVTVAHAGLPSAEVLAEGAGITLTRAANKCTVSATNPSPAAPGSAPPDIATSSSTGTPGTYACSNHSHGHGSHAGSTIAGTYHAPASGTLYGLMSPGDFTKLGGIAAGATNTAAPPNAPSAAPPTITAAASSMGTAGTYAAHNHSHGHGDIAAPTGVGTYHGAASASAYGFMSPTDFSKSANLASNPNSAYAAAGHTHNIASASVTGFLSNTDWTKFNSSSPTRNYLAPYGPQASWCFPLGISGYNSCGWNPGPFGNQTGSSTDNNTIFGRSNYLRYTTANTVNATAGLRGTSARISRGTTPWSRITYAARIRAQTTTNCLGLIGFAENASFSAGTVFQNTFVFGFGANGSAGQPFIKSVNGSNVATQITDLNGLTNAHIIEGVDIRFEFYTNDTAEFYWRALNSSNPTRSWTLGTTINVGSQLPQIDIIMSSTVYLLAYTTATFYIDVASLMLLQDQEN